jgi:uncharacterized RDD family membrane protein YckC
MRPADALPGESWPDGTGSPTFVQKRRLYAGAIDMVFLPTLSFVFLNGYHEAISDDPNPNPFLGWWQLAPAIAVAAPYGAVTELVWGRTLGKALTGIRVVAFRGTHIWWRVILRDLTKILWFLPPCLLLDIVLICATPKARRWIDSLVGTTVIASPTHWPFSRPSS